MFGNMIGFSEFWGSGFRCEDLIMICFCLQIGNDNILKPNNEIWLKCEYQLKLKTIRTEKMLQLTKSVYLKNKFEVSKH